MKKPGITAGCRIWLENDGEVFLAPGKAALLKHINETGSLRNAAEQMNMSYRKAWYSLKMMNENAPEPLVKITRGGSGGGSSSLTEFGARILSQYESLLRLTTDFLEEQLKNTSDG